jgi:hypothetical protein
MKEAHKWITSKSELSVEGNTLKLYTLMKRLLRASPDLDLALKEKPQKYITSKSKLSFEGKTLRLFTSENISKFQLLTQL